MVWLRAGWGRCGGVGDLPWALPLIFHAGEVGRWHLQHAEVDS